MLSQTEKFSAIRAVFPHIPKSDLSRVAERIRTDSDLYRIGSIVIAFIRHGRTARTDDFTSRYDTFAASGQIRGGLWKEAREMAKESVF